MKKYQDLKIWQQGVEIACEVYGLSAQLPEDEKYGLKSQINRAAVSIPSNIAEGSARSSDKDYKRFLEISLGSVFELTTQLIIIDRLQLLPQESINKLLENLEIEGKMINSFIQILKKPTANG